MFSDFCACGCNSFAVKVLPGVAPLTEARENPSSGYGAIHTADFKMTDGRTLEVALFADDSGNLVYVEVDCCANSYPVPDDPDVEAKPFPDVDGEAANPRLDERSGSETDARLKGRKVPSE
jgi:hypothetical protein